MRIFYKIIIIVVAVFFFGCATSNVSNNNNDINYSVERTDGVSRVSVRKVADNGADIEFEFKRNGRRVGNEIENLSVRSISGDQEINPSGFKGLRNVNFPAEVQIQYSYYNPMYSSTRYCYVIVTFQEKGNWLITMNH